MLLSPAFCGRHKRLYALQNHTFSNFRSLSQTVVAFLTYKAQHGIFNRILVKHKKIMRMESSLESLLPRKDLEVAKTILQ